MRFSQNLKAITDTKDRHPAMCRTNKFFHDGCELGNGAATQVIAVKKQPNKTIASTECKFASACQSGTDCPPATRIVRAASLSSREPGKVTAPTQAVMDESLL